MAVATVLDTIIAELRKLSDEYGRGEITAAQARTTTHSLGWSTLLTRGGVKAAVSRKFAKDVLYIS